MAGAAPFYGKAKVRPAGDKILLPYQERWVKDGSLWKLCEKSRQIGWTWSTAYAIVRRSALAGAKDDTWISSRDEIQAKLFIQDCLKFANLLKIAAEDLGSKVIDDKGNTAQILRFATGVTVNSMSSNPDAQAGKRGSRVLDEFALHQDPRQLFSIATPGLTWGGQLEIFSTHRGSANFFNELVQEAKHKGNPKNFSLHTVTLTKALSEGFLYKLQSKLPKDDPRQQLDEADYWNQVKAGCADEETFLQEYECIPGDDKAAFLSYDAIASCQYPAGDKWEHTLEQLAALQGRLHIGVDIGRDHDLTVIWVLEKLGDVYYTRHIRELQNCKFAEQEAILYDILRLPNVRRCCIDRNGIGRQFAERATERFPGRVEEVKFTQETKQDMAVPLKLAFEDRSIRIPWSRAIQADLRGVKKETTASGNDRFTADRGKNGHSDRFWALALALHSAQTLAQYRITVCEE